MQLAISERVRRPAPVGRIREAKWETPVLVHSRMTIGEHPVLASSERLVWLSPRTVKACCAALESFVTRSASPLERPPSHRALIPFVHGMVGAVPPPRPVRRLSRRAYGSR